MPYTIDWFVEDQVFLVDVAGAVSMDELRALIDDYKTYVKNGEPPVHCIIDVNRMTTSPRRIQDVRELLPALDHEEVGWVILVSRNTFTNLMSSILLRFNGVQFRTFHTRDDSLAFLYSHDPSLARLVEPDSA